MRFACHTGIRNIVLNAKLLHVVKDHYGKKKYDLFNTVTKKGFLCHDKLLS